MNEKGVFQWASVASLVALAGAISSAVFSRLSYTNSIKSLEQQKKIEQKKIDADIRAKARIEWIQEVRRNFAKFLEDYRNLEVAEYYKPRELGVPASNDIEKLITIFRTQAILLSLLFATTDSTEDKFCFKSDRARIYYVDKNYRREEQAIKEAEIEKENKKNCIFFEKLLDVKSNEDKNALIISLLEDILDNPATTRSSQVSNGQHDYNSRMYDVELAHQKSITTQNIKKLSKAILIYLKIDWDIAKDGR